MKHTMPIEQMQKKCSACLDRNICIRCNFMHGFTWLFDRYRCSYVQKEEIQSNTRVHNSPSGDILVALFQVLLQLVMGITFILHGNIFCKLVKYMQVGTMYSFTYVLIMTSLERYMSKCDPLNSQTWTTKIYAFWLIVITTSSHTNKELMKFMAAWIIFANAILDSAGFLYAVQLVILTICYTKICHIVWVSVNAKETHNAVKRKTHYRNGCSPCHTKKTVTNPRAHSKKMSKSKIKTVKLTLIVVICFIVCWAPFFIRQMWSAFDNYAPCS
ncbi:CTR2-like protein [Mya arenaria]|uniref:CTR2-like protein n=1 Tax=Mya arenaria TaxID=6604 RepID=A0ABY7EMM6_MYAAR|nr:CTR2-like protein [Mya arenaria]